MWLAGQGWVRIDPTAAVSPDRITLGVETLPEFSFTPRIFGQNTVLSKLWRKATRRWDSINHSWNRWVLSYDDDKQQRLLSKIGLDSENWLHIGLGVLASIAVLLLIFTSIMLLSSRHTDPVARLYEKYCQRLASKGLARKSNEGPEDFAKRVCEKYPQFAEQVVIITQCYINLRYGVENDNRNIQKLKLAVRSFSL